MYHQYEVSVAHRETYNVLATNEKMAKTKALDCFWDDDEWYDYDPEHLLTENNCEVIDVR